MVLLEQLYITVIRIVFVGIVKDNFGFWVPSPQSPLVVL